MSIESWAFLVLQTFAATADETPVFGPPERLLGGELALCVDYEGVGVAVGDWDGDGKKDLLGSNWVGGIYWYRNVGTDADPKFDRGRLLVPGAAGPPPRKNGGNLGLWKSCGRLAVLDWNGDGRLDVIVGYRDLKVVENQLLLYLREEGDGLRKIDLGKDLLRGPLSGLGIHPAPCAADWNGDGRPDLLLGSSKGNVYVYRNEGPSKEPAFPREALEFGLSGEETVPAAGDLNGDGRVDLVVGLADGRLLAWFNRGTSAEPQFGEPRALWQTSRQFNGNPLPAVPCVVDWDSDGRNEILIGTERRLTLLKLSADGRDVKEAVPIGGSGFAFNSGGNRHIPPYTVDLDGDGLLDLVVHADGKTMTNSVVLYRNRGTVHLPLFETGEVLQTSVERAARYTFADWNGDGTLDLFGGSKYDPTPYVAFNRGTRTQPRFYPGELPKEVLQGKALPPEGVRLVYDLDGNPVRFGNTRYAVDWDTDGLVDILVDEGSFLLPKDPLNGVVWYRNVGTPREPRFERARIVEVEGKQLSWQAHFGHVWASDFDGDGDSDLLVTAEGERWANPATSKTGIAFLRNDAGRGRTPVLRPAVFLRDGDGFIGPLTNALGREVHEGHQVGVTDLNGDGRPDLLQTHNTGCFEIVVRYGRKRGECEQDR